MSNYKERVQQELDELTENTVKLGSFIKSDSFNSIISITEQELLKQQLELMTSYAGVLILRVDLHKFTKD